MNSFLKDVIGCFVLVFVVVFFSLYVLFDEQTPQKVELVAPVVAPPVVVEAPKTYEITHQIPEKYLSYDEILAQLKEWNEQAKEITEIGSFGKNNVGDDLIYFRMGTKGKPVSILHSNIHGNEILACAVNLSTMGRMLNDYGRDSEVTNIIKENNIYFVPVFDPESYRNNERFIEGMDPNRNWPYNGRKSNSNNSTSILAMQKWIDEIKPKAMLDIHTFGRLIMQPSDTSENDKQKIKQLANEMEQLSGYDPVSIGSVRDGYAINYYYWKAKCVSMLIEIGPGPSHNASVAQIKIESDKTYKMFLLFMKKAPLISLEGIDSIQPESQPNNAQPQPRRRLFKFLRSDSQASLSI